eukprot:gene22315-28899_t
MSVAAPKMKDSLHWSDIEKGYVLSSFYWGYALGQIPASIYTQLYGAKWLFGFSILIPSILTLLVPIASTTSLVSLTYFFANWVFGFIGFMLLSEMPSYLTEILNFNLKSAGLLCIAPYAGMFILSMSFGIFFETMQEHYDWSNRLVRQIAQFIAFGGSGSMLIICGYVDDKYIAYSFMVFGQALLGVSQCGLACNTIGAIAGIVGPIIVASFTTTWSGRQGWENVFLLTGVMCTISLIFWSLFQTSNIVDELNTPAN